MILWLDSNPVEGQDSQEPAAIYEIDDRSVDWSPVKGLIVQTHRVIRVNRSAGADAGRIRIWDTFFQRLKSFDGEVKDTTGRTLFRVGFPDVRSVAPFSEFRLYSGDVVRSVELIAAQTPFVIDVRWTVEIDNAFFWPDWVFEDSWPRRSASYEVLAPPDQSVRWREVSSGLERTERQIARRNVTRWSLQDWKPPEPDAVPLGMHPLVHVAPEEFKVGRLKGRTDSWDALGRWYWSLTKNQIELKTIQQDAVTAHVRDKVGERARATALKDWISDHWRYVAIEVGLGGWRPSRASEVFDNRYGDCKDAVFLWIAMMRTIGLEAHPALVRARNPLPIEADFPKDWFDHVIGVTVINGDTLWADLSDPRYPMGTLPRACESRWALVVGEFGGQLWRTPGRRAEENRFTTRLDGVLNENGDLTFNAGVFASGHFARQLPLQGRLNPQMAAAVILGVTPTAIDAWLDSISVVSGDAIYAHLHGVMRGWALAGQKQIVVRPRTAGWVTNDTLGGRPDPSRVDFAQDVSDSLLILMPEGWVPDFWPEASSIEDTVGNFIETRSYEEGQLKIWRQLRVNTPARELEERRAAARLRAAYRLATGAEWVFKRGESRLEGELH